MESGRFGLIVRLLVLCPLVAASGQLGAEERRTGNSTLSITGATLIDGTDAEPVQDATLVIDSGYITCIGRKPECPVDSETTVIDATGKWLVPGLIDSHVHWQIWFDEEGSLSRETAARAAQLYLANGVTTLVDVGGQRRVSGANRQVLDQLDSSGQPAPRIFYSGWIDGKEIQQSDSKDAGVIAAELLSSGAIGIKVHNGLDQQDYKLIMAAAERAGRPVYGHTYYLNEKGFLNLTSEALEAGIDGIFHILGIPPVSPEEMPPLPAESMDNWQAWWVAGAKLWLYVTPKDMDELIQLMTNNQAWLQPTLITEHVIVQPDFYQDSPNWVYSPVPRESMRLGMPVLDRDDLEQYTAAYEQMEIFVKRFYEAGGMIVSGTDGLPLPAFGLHDELRLLSEAGIPPLAVIQSATRNPAKAWRLQDQVGTLQQGRAADLLILDGDPLLDIAQTRNIWRVVKSGVVYNPEDLMRQEGLPRQ